MCKDVKVEPSLLPYVQPAISGNDKDRGRLDVSAIGVWSPCEKSMCDIRVFHPNAPSHMNRPLPALYAQNEAEKKAAYNDRVLNVENATFTPLVFATTGGMGMESSRFFKKVAEMLAGKRKEQVSCVLAYVRTRLRFALLRATLVAVRGVRGKKSENAIHTEDISFNLIPSVEVD